MPPKRSRVTDENEESEMVKSIKEMKKEILDSVNAHKEEMSQQIAELKNIMEEEKMAAERKRTDKEFVLKHTFTNVAEMVDGVNQFGPKEDHFGQKWRLYMRRNGEYLAVFLNVDLPDESGEWMIQTDHELEVVGGKNVTRCKHLPKLSDEGSANGKARFMSWDEMKRIYLKGNKLEVVARVKILNMSGVVKPKAFDFGESNKKCSTVVLMVGTEKFYVSKEYLIHHSPYFRAFFSRNFKEGQSGPQEFELPQTDAQDFQDFLEILYGNAEVDECSLEGVLSLADYYHVDCIRRKCENFLMNQSKMTMKRKLELSSRFQLKSLTDKCISEMTVDDYKTMIKDGVLKNASLYLANALAEKAVSFL